MLLELHGCGNHAVPSRHELVRRGPV